MRWAVSSKKVFLRKRKWVSSTELGYPWPGGQGSPELLLGQRPYDKRADLWSLGIVLADLWSGAPPYSGSKESIVERIFLHRKVPVAKSPTALLGYERAPIDKTELMQNLIDSLAQLNPMHRAPAASLLARAEVAQRASRDPLEAQRARTASRPSGQSHAAAGRANKRKR